MSPFTGRRWPRPGGAGPAAWFPDPHGSPADQLPPWIAPELWRIELDGILGAEHGRIFARRGRLLGRIEEWDEATAHAFARDCCGHVLAFVSRWDGNAAVRAALLGDAPMVANAASANVAGYFAALAAERVGGPEAAAGERRRQAGWMVARLPSLTQPSHQGSPDENPPGDGP